MLELEAFELEGLKVILHYARLKDIWDHIYDPRLYVHSLLWIFLKCVLDKNYNTIKLYICLLESFDINLHPVRKNKTRKNGVTSCIITTYYPIGIINYCLKPFSISSRYLLRTNCIEESTLPFSRPFSSNTRSYSVYVSKI